MSRSTRKPYYYWVGAFGNVKSDRQMAARRYRALEKQSMHEMLRDESFEDYVHPDRYEANYNDRNSWGCDGGCSLHQYPDRFDLTLAGLGDESWLEYQLDFHKRIQRK